MQKTIFERNYRLLEKIFIEDLKEVMDKYSYLKFESKGFMPLHFDALTEKTFALSHTYEQNGDVIPDPDMTIEINFQYNFIQALTYQDYFGYRRVYEFDEQGNKKGVRLKAQKELNRFLKSWLKNILEQGHKRTEEKLKEGKI